MKRYILILFPLALLLSGCFFYFNGIVGSGRLVTRDYYLVGFQGVKSGDAAQVNITSGNYYDVSVICDDNMLAYVNVYSDGYYLNVELLPGYSYSNITYTVNVTMPTIRSLDAEEASDVQISGFTLTDYLNLYVTDASDVRVYLTDASDLDLTVEDASYLEIHSVYPVEIIDIGCSGASTADLRGMLCGYGEITVTDASSLRVNMAEVEHVSSGLIGQVSGASVLYYRGPYTPGPILFSGASGIVYY